MSKETEIIEQLTKEFLQSFGAEKGIAILSSVICMMYEETDKKNAMILAQPTNGVIVITTTMDAVDQIPDIIEKTMEQLPTVMRQITENLDKMGETSHLGYLDGDTGETMEDPSEKPPADKRKFH